MMRIRRAAQFPDRMHRQLRNANVQRAHPELGGGQRSDRRTAGHVGAADERLHRHFRAPAALAEQRLRLTVGRIPLIGIDLDHGPAVEHRSVSVVMLVRKVGVDAVGVVHGHHDRRGDGPRVVLVRGGETSQHVKEKGPASARGAHAADFLVVVQHHEQGLFRRPAGLDQGTHRDVAANEIVQARAGDEFLAPADECRRLQVVQRQFEVEHGICIDLRVVPPQLRQQQLWQVELAATEQCRKVSLGVDAAPLIDVPVQMDGQARDGGNRALNIQQMGANCAGAGAYLDAAGEPEVAIEPGVQQDATVDLHAQPGVAAAVAQRIGFQAQTRTVGVGADHAPAAFRVSARTGREGDQRRAVARDVVTTVGFDPPRRAAVERSEPCTGEPAAQQRGGVVRGWCSREE